MTPPDDKSQGWEIEASMLLEAGGKVITKLMDEAAVMEKEKEVMALLLDQKLADIAERDDTIAEMMIELGEWQSKYADLCEKLQRTRADMATVVRAVDAGTQLIEALLAWMPEGLVLSPIVGSAKGAWSEAMQAVIQGRGYKP